MKLRNSKYFLSLTLDKKACITDFMLGPNKPWFKNKLGFTEIYDVVKKKSFSSREVKSNVVEKRVGPEYNIVRISPGGITWHEKMSLDQGRFIWRVSLSGFKEQPREVRIRYVFPLPDTLFPYNRNWALWAASQFFPMELMDILVKEIEYGCVDGGIMIPAVVFYERKENIGFTLFKPFDLKIPQLRFRFDRHYRQIIVEYGCMEMKPGSEVETQLEIFPHEGDWRSGMDFLVNKRHPEYFYPVNKNAYKSEGFFIQTGAKYNGKALGKKLSGAFRGFPVTLSEVHHHFEHYGEYYPSRNEWWNVHYHEIGHKEGYKITREKIKRHLRALKDYGIIPLMYWQGQGDASIKHMARRFSKAMARDEFGNIIPLWIRCGMMNGDPSLDFGPHLLDDAKKIMKEYGDLLGGFFIDQLCYGFRDFAHSDGISIKGDKKFYHCAFAYDWVLKELSARSNKRGMLLFGNGPFNIEVARYLDGLMAEGKDWVMAMFYGMTFMKPFICFTYHNNPIELELSLRLCLKYGAFPGMPFDGILTSEMRKVYLDYLPLLKHLRGKRWVLTPNPFSLPPNMDGNIFQNREGNYIITILTDKILYSNSSGQRVVVGLNLKVSRIKEVKWFSIGENKARKLPFEGKRGCGRVVIPNHRSASLLCLVPQE